MKPIKNCPSAKVRHETEQDARYAIREKELFFNAPKLDVYFCINCLGYHLTSTKRIVKTKKKIK